MTDELAFIRSIKACPQDDAPRLVFADWLEEHGQEARANFIRRSVQNSASNIMHSVHLSYRAYKAGEQVTFEDLMEYRPWEHFRADFITQVIVAGVSYQRCVVWHRGFPVIVGCTERNWHRYGVDYSWPIQAVCYSDSPQPRRLSRPEVPHVLTRCSWIFLNQFAMYPDRLAHAVNICYPRLHY